MRALVMTSSVLLLLGCDAPPTPANDVEPDAAGDCIDTCGPAYCGNGIVDPGEVCDDGNILDGDGCSGSCRSDESCGNGIVDVSVGEACDDGNTTSGDGCRASCTLPGCGD